MPRQLLGRLTGRAVICHTAQASDLQPSDPIAPLALRPVAEVGPAPAPWVRLRPSWSGLSCKVSRHGRVSLNVCVGRLGCCSWALALLVRTFPLEPNLGVGGCPWGGVRVSGRSHLGGCLQESWGTGHSPSGGSHSARSNPTGSFSNAAGKYCPVHRSLASKRVCRVGSPNTAEPHGGSPSSPGTCPG